METRIDAEGSTWTKSDNGWEIKPGDESAERRTRLDALAASIDAEEADDKIIRAFIVYMMKRFMPDLLDQALAAGKINAAGKTRIQNRIDAMPLIED